MIEIVDDDHPNGFAHPDGLSVEEARSLDCGFFSRDRQLCHGCMGFGHYLCGECASLSPDSHRFDTDR